MTTSLVRRVGPMLYYLLWAAIVGISVHDGYLVILNQHSISFYEENPVGRWLIDASGGDIRLLLAAKVAGTLIVASVLLVAYWKSPRIAWPVCLFLAAFQFGLLIYLNG